MRKDVSCEIQAYPWRQNICFARTGDEITAVNLNIPANTTGSLRQSRPRWQWLIDRPFEVFPDHFPVNPLHPATFQIQIKNAVVGP